MVSSGRRGHFLVCLDELVPKSMLTKRFGAVFRKPRSVFVRDWRFGGPSWGGRETVPVEFLGKYWADGGERGHFRTRLATENLKIVRLSGFSGLVFELWSAPPSARSSGGSSEGTSRGPKSGSNLVSSWSLVVVGGIF